MKKQPDRIYVGKNDRDDLYAPFFEQTFKGKTRKEQFFFAMAIGFKNGVKHPLKAKNMLFLSKDLNEEDNALLNAVAMFDKKTPDILANQVEVFKIAEEYAHAGIKLLIEKMKSVQFGTFEKQFELDISKIYEQYDLNSDGEKVNPVD